MATFLISGDATASSAPPAVLVPGQFNVSATGAATYTIPIAVPAGTAGMVPALSLNYSSQGGDGVVGLGWTLGGLPTISRCPKTNAQDGAHSSVNFDDSSNASAPINDRLCLDGQRLVAIAGVYGRDGSEYRTELEGFSKIVVHGIAGINGPGWFEVHTKAGQILEFGNTTSSRIFPVKADGTVVSTVVRTWAVDQVSDSVGNYLTVTYVNDTTNGEVQFYPTRIDYTGHTANPTQAPYNSVRFSYGSRPDHAPMYQAGMQQQTTVLLTDITTYLGPSNAVYHYKLVYGNGSTVTHSRLTSVTLCGGGGTCTAPCNGGTNCLATTQFGWQGGASTIQVQEVQNDIAHGKYVHYGNGTFFTPNGASMSDFNADGLTDVIVLQPISLVCPQGNTIYYGQLDGSFTPANMMSNFAGDHGSDPHHIYYPDGPACFYFDSAGGLPIPLTYTVDLNADGYTDVAAYNLNGANNGHTMYMANDGLGNFNRYGPETQSLFVFSDYNGDGLVDAISASNYAINQASSPGTFVLNPYNIPLGGAGQNDVRLVGDFDGDACGDFLYQIAGGINEIFYSPICSTASPLSISNWTNNSKFITLGDFNGDGKTDILVTSKTVPAVLYLSSGTSLVATTLDSSTSDWGKYAIATGDWNGDGKTDIALIAAGGTGNYGSPHAHNIMISTGTSFVQGATIANTATSGTTISTSVADWNSDGTSDLWLQQAPHDYEELMSTQTGAPFAPEMISTIDNGIDSITTITYDKINNPAIYTKASNGAYPTEDLDGPLYVVARVDASNGLGACVPPATANCYSSTYSYTGAKADLTGRGFLGFQSVKITDLQTHIEQTTNYLTDFPLTGQIDSQKKVCPNGQAGCPSGGVTLSLVQNTYDVVQLDPGTDGVKRTFVALQSGTDTTNDLDGAAMPTVTNTYIYDCDTLSGGKSICTGASPTGFGNTTKITMGVSDGSSRITSNTYANDATSWYLGRLLTANVESINPNISDPTISDLTRKTTYCYALSYATSSLCPASANPTGLLTAEYVEHLNTNRSTRLETDYTYDPFGNRMSAVANACVWVNATNCSFTTLVATRETDTEFSTTSGNYGQFLTKTTNAFGKFETWTYATTAGAGNGIPAAFGLPDSHTGPNGFVTNWTYDIFGRTTYEHRPDKTFDTTTYTDCTSANLPAGEVAPSVCAFAVVTTRKNDYYGSDHIAPAGPTTVTFYDSLSRVVAQDTEGYNSGNNCTADTSCWIRVATIYGTGGRVLKTSRPYFLNGETPKYTVFAYDAIGRVVTKTEPGSVVTTYNYDGLTTSVTIDTNGKAQTTTAVKNAQGLVASVQDPQLHTTSYVYTAFGDLSTVTDPSTPTANVTHYYYDDRGRKIQADDPDMHTWLYVYDGFGELYSQTDAKGQVTTLTYDQLGRVLKRVAPDLTSTFGYDSGTNGVGHLTSETASGTASGSGVTRTYDYGDAFGRINFMTTTVDGTSYTYTYTYHSNGQISNVYYPSGFSVQYWQTSAGYPLSMNDYNNGQALLQVINTRDAELHILTETQGNTAINTTQTFYANTGLPHTSVATSSAGTVANMSYVFDTLGNLTQRTWRKTAAASVTEVACYDSLNRMHQSNAAGACTDTGNVTVDYDQLGNLTRKSDVCNSAACMVYGENGAGPHALTSIHYSGSNIAMLNYDQNGNMLTGMGRTVTYNSFNMAALISDGPNTTALTYDANRARIKQVITGAGAGTTYYLNDPFYGALEEVAVVGSTTNWHDYLINDGHMVGERSCTGASSPCTGTPSINYFSLDHLGSIAVIADSGGNVLERLSFDPWGKRRNADGTAAGCGTITSSASRGFTGQEMMDGACLVNFNARVYDPSLGRFLSADPVTQSFYNLQLLNRYSYVGNNPLSLTDPSGLCFLGCFWNNDIFRAVVAIVVAYFAPEVLGSFETNVLGATAEVEGESVLGVVNIGIAGGLAGYVSTGKLSGALTGALQAELFLGVGDKLEANPEWFMGSSTASTFVAHGMVGGIVSSLSGGRYGSGFLAAGVGSLADSPSLSTDSFGLNVAEHAVLGGAGSVLGGGKFVNGAITGAFGYLFNRCAHTPCVRGDLPSIQGEMLTCLQLNDQACIDRVEAEYEQAGGNLPHPGRDIAIFEGGSIFLGGVCFILCAPTATTIYGTATAASGALTAAKPIFDGLLRVGTVVQHMLYGDPEVVEIDIVPEPPAVTETSPEFNGWPRPFPQTNTEPVVPPH